MPATETPSPERIIREKIAAGLDERADSYSHDAVVLKEQGDEPMAAAYRAICETFREVGKEIRRG